ncbi:hypothetical protein YC2023_107020 [Brassica napus]
MIAWQRIARSFAMAHSSTAPAILLLNDILPGGELRRPNLEGLLIGLEMMLIKRGRYIEAGAADS